jgi:hypothetical protein
MFPGSPVIPTTAFCNTASRAASKTDDDGATGEIYPPVEESFAMA